MYQDPIFTIFGHGVNLYGISLAVGLLCCIIMFFVLTTKMKTPEKVQDFMFYVAIGAIALGFLAAKFYQAVYDWIETGVFDFYGAGMTVMGGLVGGVVAFLALYFGIGPLIFKDNEKGLHVKHFKDVFNVAPACITIAHAFGRIGCLFAGCCHGEYLGQNYVFGGIYMTTPDDGSGYFVPTQLYEALFLFALTIVLTILCVKRYQITMHIYLIAYGFWRIFIEFFRADERGAFVLGLAPSQWQSIIFILAGVILFIFYIYKKWKFVLPEELPEEQPALVENNDDIEEV